ncbi:MAG TPA: hypothetical protein DEP72_02690 [Clostridiales bacterium]|nr:MAG: hypothetical protein A2Y18_06525 [Clostridiales bacterium GWD2_32_19]HCC07062.1 hypothetical protein [Clostridiales bacterium]
MRLKEQKVEAIQNDDLLGTSRVEEDYDTAQYKANSRYKVLVVDDERGILDSLEVILKRGGFRFKGFSEPSDALKELENDDSYNILVTDYFMEPIHGDELIEKIRVFNKKIHILLLTGYKDQAPAIETLKRLNIQGYCEKSNNFDQLLLWLYSAVKVLEQNKDIYKLMEKAMNQNEIISELNKSLENSYSSIIESLRLAVDAKDEYTKGHSDRVSYYAFKIGQAMKLTVEELEILTVGGYFHDIGKIGIKDQIITKETRLTDEEFAEIKRHPLKGFGILESNNMFKKILPLIKYHHEKLDGTGYPEGLKDDEIPFLVRIISVADSFDAMMSKRSYRDELGIEKAVSELRKCSGTQFDPKIVEEFIKLIAEKWTEINEEVEEIDRKLANI